MKQLTNIMSDSAPSSPLDPVSPIPADTTVNVYVTNDGAASLYIANSSNDAPMEAVDANVGDGVTAREALDEALVAMIYRQGDDNVVDMLEAAGMNCPNRDHGTILAWGTYLVP